MGYSASGGFGEVDLQSRPKSMGTVLPHGFSRPRSDLASHFCNVPAPKDYHKKVMPMAFALYDFTDTRNQSVIRTWISKERLTRRDIGQLNQKLDMLRVSGMGLQPKLLAGPIAKHIYKLKIHTDRTFRPMLCKGPFSMETEFTLLIGAIEVNFKLDTDPSKAVLNREALLADKDRRMSNAGY